MEPVNGHDKEHKTALDEIVDSIPHFGDAWRVEQYQNGPEGSAVLAVMYPPNRAGLAAVPRFFSSITMMTNKGPVPIPFEIKASTVDEATTLWRSHAQQAVRDFHENMLANQRRVILPDAPRAPFPKKILPH